MILWNFFRSVPWCVHHVDLYMFEEEGRCEKSKDCKYCKQAAREVHMKNIFNLAAWDDKLRAEFKKLKANNNTKDKYAVACNTWDLKNATKVYKKNQTLTKEDIHSISLHKSKVANKASSDSFMKSYK